MAVDLFRRGKLFDMAAAHHEDPVRHGKRFALIMGHIDDRCTGAPVQILDFFAHADLEFRIEGTERFIHEQDGGLSHNGPGHGYTLALAA